MAAGIPMGIGRNTHVIRKTRAALVLTAGLTALVLSPSLVLAAGPHGTGVKVGGSEGASAEELGYTEEYAASKEAAAAPEESGGGVTTMAPPPPEEGYPSSIVLDFKIYHQKTTYYCMPAVGQSIAHHRWGGFNDPTVADKQATIAGSMGTTTGGTSHTAALNWMNNKFEDRNDNWRYVSYRAGSLAVFTSHGKFDVYYGLPMYVRVDLHSNNYPWFDSQPTPHATLLTGYTNSGNRALSADPYSTTRADGTCKVSPYSSSPNQGCIWGGASGPYQMSDYYLAVDTANGLSEWY
jgi:hypothetical protein